MIGYQKTNTKFQILRKILLIIQIIYFLVYSNVILIPNYLKKETKKLVKKIVIKKQLALGLVIINIVIKTKDVIKGGNILILKHIIVLIQK